MSVTLLWAAALLAQPEQLGPSLKFFPTIPCRALDTRLGSDTLLKANEERTLALPASACGLATSALAYSMNVTVIPRADFAPSPVDKVTFIQPFLYPVPHQPELNPSIRNPEGRVIASHLIVRSDISGSIRVHTTHETHLVIDVNGYWSLNGPGLDFYGQQPCRIVDTRVQSGVSTEAYNTPIDPMLGWPSLQPGEARILPIGASTRCGPLPESAGAYAVNITVIPKGILGYLTVWPWSGLPPLTSVLNSLDGRVTSNSAIVANISGYIAVYATDETDLLVDITGYFGPPTVFPWR